MLHSIINTIKHVGFFLILWGTDHLRVLRPANMHVKRSYSLKVRSSTMQAQIPEKISLSTHVYSGDFNAIVRGIYYL